jgi:TonB family protein
MPEATPAAVPEQSAKVARTPAAIAPPTAAQQNTPATAADLSPPLSAANKAPGGNAPAADKTSMDPSPPAAAYAEPRARQDDPALPPVGKHVPPVKPLPDSESSINSCPYPDQLLRQGHTGSVGVLVYIAPDGGAVATKVDESSGSDELDAAAARCVQDYGQFSPKRVGPRAVGYWGHMRFNFSFGG